MPTAHFGIQRVLLNIVYSEENSHQLAVVFQLKARDRHPTNIMVLTRQMARVAAGPKPQLTDIPFEIFEKIFWYTGYKEASNMRLVSASEQFLCVHWLFHK